MTHLPYFVVKGRFTHFSFCEALKARDFQLNVSIFSNGEEMFEFWKYEPLLGLGGFNFLQFLLGFRRTGRTYVVVLISKNCNSVNCFFVPIQNKWWPKMFALHTDYIFHINLLDSIRFLSDRMHALTTHVKKRNLVEKCLC